MNPLPVAANAPEPVKPVNKAGTAPPGNDAAVPGDSGFREMVGKDATNPDSGGEADELSLPAPPVPPLAPELRQINPPAMTTGAAGWMPVSADLGNSDATGKHPVGEAVVGAASPKPMPGTSGPPQLAGPLVPGIPLAQKPGAEVDGKVPATDRSPLANDISPPANPAPEPTTARAGAFVLAGMPVPVSPPGELKPEPESDADIPVLSGEARTGQTAHAPRVPAGAPAAADSGARTVAIQIAQSVAANNNRMIEVTLEPVELGKVRLALNTTEHGLSVQITAERPETIELMRRNPGILQDEFRNLGFGDVGFSFGGGQAHRDEGEPTRTEHWSLDIAGADRGPAAVAATIPALSAGLDLRL